MAICGQRLVSFAHTVMALTMFLHFLIFWILGSLGTYCSDLMEKKDILQWSLQWTLKVLAFPSSFWVIQLIIYFPSW